MRPMVHRPVPGAGNDRGNTMIIAMAVLMIMGILAAAVWAKTISGLRFSGYDKTHLQTLAVADSGIDEATFRLEQLDPEDQETLEIVELVGDGSMSGGAYQYEASRKSSNEWEITSVAEVDGVRRGIRAEAVTVPKFGFGVQTRSAMDLNGNPGDLCSYDSRSPGGEPVYCAPDPDLAPILGTSGTIECTGGGWDDIPVMIYPPATAADCGSDPSVAPADFEWEPVVAPADNLGCPNGGNFTAGVVAGLAPGNYVCNNVVLGPNGDEDLCTAEGIDMWDNVSIYVSGSLTFGGGVYINVKDDDEGCSGEAGPMMGAPPFWPTQEAGAFRVYKSSPGEIDVANGSRNPAAAMVLYAPYSEVVASGGPHVRIFGSAMLDTFRGNGRLELVGYDRSLSLITTKTYRIQNWTEIRAPASV